MIPAKTPMPTRPTMRRSVRTRKNSATDAASAAANTSATCQRGKSWPNPALMKAWTMLAAGTYGCVRPDDRSRGGKVPR